MQSSANLLMISLEQVIGSIAVAHCHTLTTMKMLYGLKKNIRHLTLKNIRFEDELDLPSYMQFLSHVELRN